MKRPRQPPIQLYRPDDASLIQEADFLLQRTDLTDEDVLDFLHGKPRRAPAESDDVNETLRHRFHQRREKIRNLKEKLRNGGARIDEDDRLVPLEAQAPGPQQPEPIFQQVNNNEQQEEQWVEQEQRETAEAIVRSVAHYREQGVLEEDFELIIIPPRETTANLTFRRICFAVVAVVSAFVVVILQTLPSSVSPVALDPYFDKLMYELVFVRHFHAHIKHCPGLHRNGSKQWRDQVLQKLGFAPEKYCDDGVLHIPAKHAILDKYLLASTEEDAALLKPFKDGVNVSWTIPCVSSREFAPDQCQATDEGECAIDSATMQQCFRGVHDNILSDEEVVDVLQFGNYLVKEQGSDNLNVFYATHLERQIPEVLHKLKLLLRETYNFTQVEPITFRITSAGPMDGYGVSPDSMALNETVYFQSVEKHKRLNELAYYSLPWPFHKKSIRDTCLLISDMEVDPRFSLLTSVFLSTGAGRDYRGGSTLFMDDHFSNYKLKDRIRRGLSVDGSQGRVVVSTSGIENRRCRLPIRAGLRSELQIWWDVSSL